MIYEYFIPLLSHPLAPAINFPVPGVTQIRTVHLKKIMKIIITYVHFSENKNP